MNIDSDISVPGDYSGRWATARRYDPTFGYLPQLVAGNVLRILPRRGHGGSHKRSADERNN
jgi:hypothetical protein